MPSSRKLAGFGAVIASFCLLAPSVRGAEAFAPRLIPTPPGLVRGDGTLSVPAQRKFARGGGEAGEAGVASNRRPGLGEKPVPHGDQLTTVQTPAPLAAGKSSKAPATSPSPLATANGVSDSSTEPSDSTLAVSDTTIMELTNYKVGFFSKADPPVLQAQISEYDLLGVATSVHIADGDLTFDTATGRFYGAGMALVSSTDQRIIVYWSTTSTPRRAADFCRATLQFGTLEPDFDKIGHFGGGNTGTSGVISVGGNGFDSAGHWTGGWWFGLQKPPSGPGCVDATTLKFAVKTGLNAAVNPVPAMEADVQTWGVAYAARPAPASDFLQYDITQAADGTPVLSSVTHSIPLPWSYAIPPSAPQAGAVQKLAVQDARLQHVWLAANPRRGNAVSAWTSQTLAAGTNQAGVAWYEIDPATHAVLDSGVLVAAAPEFLFNAAIAPDRSAGTGGGGWVMTLNSSSTAIDARVLLARRPAGGSVSTALMQATGGIYYDPTCASGGECRWGDYPGASPDPTGALNGEGTVCLVNQYPKGNPSRTSSSWGTAIACYQP